MAPFVWLVGASLRPREYVFDPASCLPVRAGELRGGVAGRAAGGLARQQPAGRGRRRRRGDPVQRLGGVRFAYFRFPGRNLLFGLVLATMMLPFAVTMIPTYLIWSDLGLDRYPGAALGRQPVRLGVLHLPAPTVPAVAAEGVLSRPPGWTGRAIRSCSGRWRFPLIRPALLVGVRLRVQGQLDGSDQAADLPARRGQLYTLPRGLKVDAGPVRLRR